MYVCMYVCMCVSMYISMCVFTYLLYKLPKISQYLVLTVETINFAESSEMTRYRVVW